LGGTRDHKPGNGLRRYRVLRPLESGAPIRVFLVEPVGEPDNSLRIFTLAAGITTGNSGDRTRVAALFEQRRSLLHPLLPEVLDLYLHGRKPGLITPRIDQLRLPETVSRWSLEERIQAALDLCRLLDFTHRSGSLWGWLNPGKIFCAFNRIHCVNHVIPGESRSQVDPSPASQRYCAPELLRDQRATVPGDLYTLGMILYFLFTGNEPYYDAYPGQADEKQKIVMPTLPGRIRPDLPGFVDTVIMNLVQKSPGDRIPLREVIGILESRAKPSRRLVPMPSSKLVGRHDALQKCTEYLEEFRRRHEAMLLVLTGPAGIGKTRLLDRVGLTAKIAGMPLFRITHTPHDRALQPFRKLVTDLRTDQDGPPLSPAAESESRSPSWFLFDRLVELAANQPVVLRISNLHWADSASIELYRHLLQARNTGVLILAERRQDEQAAQLQALESDCDELGRLRSLRLDPLNGTEARQLLDNLFPNVFSERLAGRIVEKASGNPRHIVELTRQLYRRGILRHGIRGWSPLMLHQDHWPPPSEIAEETRLRLGTLTQDQADFLRMLAFLGRPLKLARLDRVPSHTQASAQEIAWSLERLGFVRASGGFRDPTVALANHWVGESIRQETPLPEQAAIHEKILRLLESEPDDESRLLVEKAFHTVETASTPPDAEIFAAAINHLTATGQFAEAASILEALDERGSSTGEEWESARKQLDLLFRSGQFERCEHRVRALLARSWPSEHHAELLLLLGSLLLHRNDLEGATSVFGRLCGSAAPTSISEMARASLLECHARADRLGEARKLLPQILLSSSARSASSFTRRRVPAGSPSAGASHCAAEKPGQARRWRRGSPEMRPGLDLSTETARALATFFSRLGLFEESLSWRGRTIRSLYRQGLNGFLAPELLELAQDRLLAGRPQAAERIAQEALQVAEAAPCPKQLGQAMLFQSRLLRLLGRHWDSERLLDTLKGGSIRGIPEELQYDATLEQALNKCDRLLPEAALRALAPKASRRPMPHLRFDFERALALARIHSLLGDPEQALEFCGRVVSHGNRGQIVRSHLLTAEAFRLIENLDAASTHLGVGLRVLPHRWSYFRARYRIAQSRVALAMGHTDRAAALIRDPAVELVGFRFIPEQLDVLLTKSSIAIRRGDYRRARLLAEKAVLKSRATGRPSLRAAALGTLAQAEAGAGNLPAAEARYHRALGILLGFKSLLSPDLQAGFERAHVAPLRKRIQSRLRSTRPNKDPRFMLSLGRFLDCLNRLPDEKTFHSRLLECIRGQFPFSGARLHMASSAGIPGKKAAALDSVREDYLRWLETAPIEPPIQVQTDGRVVSISVALSRGSSTRGWLYLERPGRLLPELDFDLLVVLKGIIEQLLERPLKSRMDASARSLTQETTSPFIGKHPSVVELLGKVDRFARTGSTILLSGESGTGKELLARMIHEASGLKGAFVAVNCATFSRDLIESQLFGHARGAFTGATGDQTGFFEAAAGGTLFLDEISAMPFDLQPRLLRVLEQHKVIRLGETFERNVDARIVAATNRDLIELCTQKEFRSDLYHRLNVLRLEIPPLRERPSDIPLLCRHFLARLERELGLTSHLTPEALALLQQYSFPGNVRELANLLEKLACSSRDGSIDRTALESELDRHPVRDNAEMNPYLQQILADLDSGKTNFWTGVREPFLERRLSRSDVRLIVSIGLEKCEGSYRRLTRYFGLRDEDYKRFLGFLSNHGCKVDFRPYRNR